MIEINLDASATRANSGCIRKLKLSVVDGLRGKMSFNDVEYGSAMHHFRETLKRTGDRYKAITAGQHYFKSTPMVIKKGKEFLNINHLTLTMNAYAEKFGDDHGKDDFKSFVFNDQPLVENTFRYPLYQNEIGTVYGCGTIDDFGKLLNGCTGVLDLKTTTMWDRKEYFKQYELSCQLAFYLLSIKWHAKRFPDSFFGQFARQKIGAFIDVIFLSKDNPPEFQRAFYPPNDLLLEEFECALMAICERLLQNATIPLPIREGVLTGACEPKFKEPCPFRGACSSPDEISAMAILNNYFVRIPYNPLAFRKIA